MSLARAYYGAGRYADARLALAAVLARDPGHAEAQAYLGLTYEELAHFDSARTIYTRLLSTRPQGGVRRLINGRLVLLGRREMQHAAREAIARESLLAARPSDPNTVAVMPFRYVGSDSTLRPLERGLAALVVTDLSRVQRLRLVERERVQALLDELKLAESGRVDAATGARSGRLVGAGGMVQGQFQDVAPQTLRIDATIVRASDAQISATGSGADRLQALFDIEKSVVFQLLERLGITLTPAERQAISERPTQNLQAFLLYSRGLEAQDRGDFAAAAQSFQAAARIDPQFQQANQQAALSEEAVSVSSESATALPADLRTAPETVTDAPRAPDAGTLGDAMTSAVPSGADRIGTVPEPTAGGTQRVDSPTQTDLPVPAPNKLCESSASCGPPRAALIGTIIIIVRRP
jgi:tetratricopeptide (TPR) repeat protein